nr:MAG TPA: Ribosome hibernation promoting factor [Inoviridae sp.]
MRWKIVSMKDGSFEGDRGDLVEGKYLFLVPVLAHDSMDTRQPIRIFMVDRVLETMSYAPAVGDEVYLFRNENTGKVCSLLKA